MDTAWLNTRDNFKAQIIGKLLGDGCITKQGGRKARFQFIHSASDFAWSHHCYLQLKTEIPLNPPKSRKILDKRLVQGFSLSHYTQSKTSPIISYLRNTWYPNDKKIIPFEMIHKYFNEESLAWWFMDDGHLNVLNGNPLKVILSTESFTHAENNLLMKFLKQTYNLQFKTDQQNRIILYDQFQIRYFLHLVTPYMHLSMHRKMITSFNLPNIHKSKRTTLYLPKAIQLKQPTKEINGTLNNLDQIIDTYKEQNFYQHFRNEIHLRQHDIKPYQIVISRSNLERLLFLKEATGLGLSEIAELAFSLR